jgi:predicted Zn finger-like uncharacterized protein
MEGPIVIVLNCPGCGTQFEVASDLAGKKSRCKHCGHVFKIPLPSAVGQPSAPAAGASSIPPIVSNPRASAAKPPGIEPRAASAPAAVEAWVVPAIVVYCPGCRDRTEVDGALAGKKSRCKKCGEVFAIPVPGGGSGATPPSRKPPPLAADTAPDGEQWLLELDDEPSIPKVSAKPVPPPLDDALLPPPPRSPFPEPLRAAKIVIERDPIDAAVKIAGWYFLVGVFAAAVLLIYAQVAGPPPAQFRLLCAISLSLVILAGCALLIWGNIWVVVTAFRESGRQGWLCLLAPFYALGFIFGHFEKTRGAAALMICSFLVILLGFSVPLIDGALRDATPVAAVLAGSNTSTAPAGGNLGGRLDPGTTSPTANRALVEDSEKIFREYASALELVTSQLAALERNGYRPNGRAHMISSFNIAEMVDQRGHHARLGKNEWLALKHRVGEKVRASLAALKAEMTRLQAIPGLRSIFRDAPQKIDSELAFWAIGQGEEVAPELVEGPPLPLGDPPSPPVGVPRPTPHDRNGPVADQSPDRSLGAREREQYRRFLAQHGDTAVMIIFTGLPHNSDPTNGVTTRDVTEAVTKRMRVLAPAANNWMLQNIDNRTELLLAPVDDIETLAESIDFGEATVERNRIEVEVSAAYVAKLSRVPASRPPTANRRALPRPRTEPEFPADADEVDKALVELKSHELNKRKDGVRRLLRWLPDERLPQVVAALVPLLEMDDDFFVADVIKALAIWKSPDAVPALIAHTGDHRGFVRHEAIKALAKIKDERGVEPIVARIKEDGHEVEDALKEMGSIAEPALIARLTSLDTDVRRRACVILKSIGGHATLRAMLKLPEDPDSGVRAAANEAITAIIARVGPLPGSRSRRGR